MLSTTPAGFVTGSGPSGDQYSGTDPDTGESLIYATDSTLEEIYTYYYTSIESGAAGIQELANSSSPGAAQAALVNTSSIASIVAYYLAYDAANPVVTLPNASASGGPLSVSPLWQILNTYGSEYGNFYQLDPDTQVWMIGNTIPYDINPLFGDNEKSQVQNLLTQNNLIVTEATYIVTADEPQVDGAEVINLQSQMSASDFSSLQTLFSQMPRSYLQEWFNENILSSLPSGSVPQGGNLNWVVNTTPLPELSNVQIANEVYLAFIHVFNQANLNYLTSQGIALNQTNFFAWEKKKMENIYAAQAQTDDENFSQTVEAYLNNNIPSNPQAQNLIDQYATLPPLGDPGLEISRQNAVNQLLLQGEYDSVQGIIDSYRYVDSTVLSDYVKQPIPYDVVDLEGQIVQKTPVSTGS